MVDIISSESFVNNYAAEGRTIIALDVGVIALDVGVIALDVGVNLPFLLYGNISNRHNDMRWTLRM
jgi:hypothetical protein